ncbi:MAG: 5-formyltetrahydrofolate cyclo-ligase [Marivibrio sp.]|uniref:5-formyltetrahydrofolate cyclo-ligase n=1 Tax=Marivibrio sp. TaxID=2039719 RepID=UPI0032EE1B6D
MASQPTAAESEPLTHAETAEAKRLARKEAQAARKRAHEANGLMASIDVSMRFLSAIDPPKKSIVSAFLSIGTELDAGPLLKNLWARGCRVALPRVEAKDAPLSFRLYNEGDALVEESFGTRAPADTAEAVDPDILIVPMLAFDRTGYRLGYGGGFYDRSLEELRRRKTVLAVGVAFAAQEVDHVPREETDQPLDWIVTEKRAFRP